MKVEYINPFLDSAKLVIEQMIQINPIKGELALQPVQFIEEHIWINIGLTGEVSGEVLFSLQETVALKLVSAMMGGFEVTALDDMSKSAISELGNMISGNASTILYNQGVKIDITPPKVISESNQFVFTGKGILIPLNLDSIGQMKLQMLLSD